MSSQGKFMIYCAEQYKLAKHLTGKQLAELFSRYRVWEYIYSCYEALHTTGPNYIIEDIDLYIRREMTPASIGGEQQICINSGCQSPISYTLREEVQGFDSE